MKPNRWIYRFTGVLLAIVLGGAQAQEGPFLTLEGGIKAKTLQPGSGPVAEQGQVAVIHFVGWLDDKGARGRELYNSRSEGRPVSFLIGTDKVMPAWNVGVEGMQVGETRLLLIPPAMGYGAKGVDDLVPGNAPLVFRIELLELNDPS